MPMALREMLVANPVELFLFRPIAERDQVDAQLMIGAGQGLVEDLVIARQTGLEERAASGAGRRPKNRCGWRTRLPA